MKGPDQKTMAEHYIRTAEMFYRQYVDEHPSQSMDLVMFFIRQGQTDDAVNVLEQTWQNCEPITVGQVCMNIIQGEKKSKEITQRVEKVLTDAQVKFENHPGILLTLGDVRVNQDRYAEAESFYRQILEKYPEHSVAMNNLAVLLTLQGKKLDEALSLINKAIERSGHLASMLDTRACVYIAQGNAEKALKDMDEAVADAATPVRLFHQAQAFNLAKQKYAATSTMQQALKAGLSKEMLQSPEIPAYEKLRNLAGELGTAPDDKKGT
jgi:tetratricopeptide (TPR) repeat protein